MMGSTGKEDPSALPPFPKLVTYLIKGFCILFAAGMLVFALSESQTPAVQNWWIAKDPLNPLKAFAFHRAYDHEEAFHLLWGLEGLHHLPAYANSMLARRFNRDAEFYTGLVLPLVFVQIIGLLGILFQLYDF